MVEGLNSENRNAEIMDISGRVVKTIKVNTGMNVIDIENMASGSYIIRILGEREIETIKFLKK
jgi:hypothetical protein